MRTSDITDEEIIRAGEELELDPSIRVSGWQISKLIARGGNTARMERIWQAHLAGRGQPAPQIMGEEPAEDEGLGALVTNVSDMARAFVNADRARRDNRHAEQMKVTVAAKDALLGRSEAERTELEKLLGERDDRIEQFKEEVDSLEVEVKRLSDAVSQKDADAAERDHELARNEQRLVSLAAELASAKERENALRVQLEARDAEKAALAAEVRAHAARADHAQAGLAAAARELADLQATKADLEAVADDLEQRFRDAVRRGDEAEARVDRATDDLAKTRRLNEAWAKRKKPLAPKPRANDWARGIRIDVSRIRSPWRASTADKGKVVSIRARPEPGMRGQWRVDGQQEGERIDTPATVIQPRGERAQGPPMGGAREGAAGFRSRAGVRLRSPHGPPKASP